MNPLVIGADERLALQALATRAARLPLDLERMVHDVQDAAGLARYRAYMEANTIKLPVDYVACFSVEVGHPAGTVRHLAVNAGQGELLPSPSIVWKIALELGFAGDIACCQTWIVEKHGHKRQSVHLAQEVSCGAPVPEAWMELGATLH